MITNPEKYFYVSDGDVLKGIDEFLSKMKSIDYDVFRNHVNEEKNDFYNWTKEVLCDGMLAKNILKADSPQKIALAIEKRINSKEKHENKKENKKSILNKIKEAHS